MNKGLAVVGVIVGIIVLVIAFFVGGYNSLVSKQTAVEEGFANIDTQLQKVGSDTESCKYSEGLHRSRE